MSVTWTILFHCSHPRFTYWQKHITMIKYANKTFWYWINMCCEYYVNEMFEYSTSGVYEMLLAPPFSKKLLWKESYQELFKPEKLKSIFPNKTNFKNIYLIMMDSHSFSPFGVVDTKTPITAKSPLAHEAGPLVLKYEVYLYIRRHYKTWKDF